MENMPVNILELYRIYKQSRGVKCPSDLAYNRIKSGDLYFTWAYPKKPKSVKFILWRFMPYYIMFFLKPVISFLKNSKQGLGRVTLFGGNAFAKEAIKKGANFAVIDNKRAKKGPKYILVTDVRDTITNLAVLQRKKSNIQFVAITGSCGKTTTRGLTCLVLRKKYSVESSSSNVMPVIQADILNFNESTEIAVMEIGTANFGVIKQSCEIIQPHCGLITCIGKAHLQGLKSIEGVLKAKGELFDYLISTNGHIFKNLNDSKIVGMANNYENITTFGSTTDANIYGEITNTFPFLTIKWYPSIKSKREYYHASTKLFGEYNLDNILSAISVGLYFDVPPKLINEAIQEYETTNLRSQEKKIGSNTIILDSYNANPTSMRAALKNFTKMITDIVRINPLLPKVQPNIFINKSTIFSLTTLNIS